MKYLINTNLTVFYAPVRCCDIFGVGAVASAATNVMSTAMTNSSNEKIARENNETAKDIHRMDNDFNAEEAEKARAFNAEEAEKTREYNTLEAQKARQFNAQEAEKARQWNSEEAVMQRRKEAGLNVATTGGSVTASQASASGSAASASPVTGPSASASAPPNLATPTLVAPSIDGANLLNALSRSSEVLKSNDVKEEEKKLIQKQQNVAQQEFENRAVENDILRIQRANKPYELLLQNNKVKSEIMQNYNNVPVLNALAQKYDYEVNNLVFQGALSMAQHNLNVQTIMANYEQFVGKLQFEADKMFSEWKQKSFSLSYDFGIKKTTSNNVVSSSSDTLNSGFGLDGDVNLGGGPSFLPAGGSAELYFNRSNTSNTFESAEKYNQFIESFQNTNLMRQATKLKCAVKLLSQSKTKDERLIALSVCADVLGYVNHVLEAHDYIKARRQLLVPLRPDVFGTDPMLGYEEIH